MALGSPAILAVMAEKALVAFGVRSCRGGGLKVLEARTAELLIGIGVLCRVRAVRKALRAAREDIAGE